LFSKVPNWKQRIGGQSIPEEKFAIRKAKRFLSQNNQLVLPAIELVYVWNGFNILGMNQGLLEGTYNMVKEEKKKIEARKGKSEARKGKSASSAS
jgi:hypothetical protein